MGFFDKAKQLGELNKMRQQAMKLQKELEKIVITMEERGVKVKVRGDQKVESILMNGEEMKDVVEAINKAMKEVQKKSAQKMMEMGGGLSGLLGKM
ncbi:MAG: YbaB/EbfC family nucleoid-associated protein [Patescibacteria group bacterium]